ncbi:MAG: CopG family transcriptional regulator, partial [Thermoproteota archaeon]
MVVQLRLPARLVRELDRLTEEGYYGSRTEAVADAIRHLLERYR